MSYIVVQNYMNLPEKASNSVPFSWRIKDYLEELWVHTQYCLKAWSGPLHGLGEGSGALDTALVCSLDPQLAC